MIKALMLVFDTTKTWEKVFREQRSTTFILFAHLLPLLVLTSIAEGYGLMHWGEPQWNLNRVRQFTLNEALEFELGQLLLSILVVFVGAWIIKSLGETFHGKHNINQSFTVVAYGLSPLFTLRLLDTFAISPWVPWAVGILLAATILYQGLPRIMRPDPPHALGLYLMSVLMLTIATGLARFVTAWYLQGRFTPAESIAHFLNSASLFS